MESTALINTQDEQAKIPRARHTHAHNLVLFIVRILKTEIVKATVFTVQTKKVTWQKLQSDRKTHTTYAYKKQCERNQFSKR